MPLLPSRTDIAVVGAGPAGLALACELQRLGKSALVLDRQAAGANTSRAAVVHARTLEVLDPLGATADLIAEGIEVPVFKVRDRDKTLLTIGFEGIPSPYPFTLMCPQDRTEAILLAQLRALGGTVVRPAEVRAIDIADDAAHLDVDVDGATQRVTSRWLVGCDGAHSRVREAARIDFVGEAYPQSFILADVRMQWPLARDEVDLFFSPAGLVVVAPLPGDRFRVVATMDDAPAEPTIDDVQAVLDQRGPRTERAKVADVVWSSRFRVQHRVAASPRNGPVLLCGDAAHVHSPAGGQGMNTGIQDAVSLARVLASVARGGDEEALDEWARRRHRVADGVVALTHRMTRVATLRSPIGRSLRNAAVTLAGRMPPLTGALARTLAGLNNN